MELKCHVPAGIHDAGLSFISVGPVQNTDQALLSVLESMNGAHMLLYHIWKCMLSLWTMSMSATFETL